MRNVLLINCKSEESVGYYIFSSSLVLYSTFLFHVGHIATKMGGWHNMNTIGTSMY